MRLDILSSHNSLLIEVNSDHRKIDPRQLLTRITFFITKLLRTKPVLSSQLLLNLHATLILFLKYNFSEERIFQWNRFTLEIFFEFLYNKILATSTKHPNDKCECKLFHNNPANSQEEKFYLGLRNSHQRKLNIDVKNVTTFIFTCARYSDILFLPQHRSYEQREKRAQYNLPMEFFFYFSCQKRIEVKINIRISESTRYMTQIVFFRQLVVIMRNNNCLLKYHAKNVQKKTRLNS